jgi:putative lipoprotein
MKLQGTVAFEAGAPPFSNADLHLRLEDVSEADVPARALAQTTLRGVSWNGDPALTTAFSLSVAAVLEPGREYQLRAHLDLQRTGEVGLGDFITTQSYPVRPALGAQRLALRLSWLRP